MRASGAGGACVIVTALLAACGGTPRAERELVFDRSPETAAAALPFSDAVRAGDLWFVSGQLGIRPGERQLVPGGVEAETAQALENIRTTLETHGYSLRDVVKCTVMLADIAEWAAFNEVYKTFFSPPYPARSALGANGLAIGARVEVECIAVRERT